MTELEIFNHLFGLAQASKDPRGAVAACLVRDGKILVSSASSDDSRFHAEYLVLRKAEEKEIKINREDVIYVTLQPCDFRSPEGKGKDLPDCTNDMITHGAKHVVYGAKDPLHSATVDEKFEKNGGKILQIQNEEIVNKCKEIFNKSLIEHGQENKKL
jgi:pyrimidine deaminase RibD-like protein